MSKNNEFIMINKVKTPYDFDGLIGFGNVIFN